jgi:hypothetical protein
MAPAGVQDKGSGEMDERYVRLWLICLFAMVAGLILAGLVAGIWREEGLRVRFRLGTLMMLMTLAAVLVWFIMFEIHRFNAAG